MRASVTIVAATAALLVGAAAAHEGATGIVAKRMATMTYMDMKLKAIQTMLAGWAAFDLDTLRENAVILRDASHRSEGMFKSGRRDRATHARAVVWEKPDAFRREYEKLYAAVEALNAAAASGERTDIAIAASDLRMTCDGCHATFRKPE
jgi:cytochrome c556